MNKADHIIIGAFSALGIYSLFKLSKNEKITLQGAATSMAAGGLIGMAPDLIEPPTNPNHRSFFHSLGFLMLLSAGNLKMWKSNSIPEEVKEALSIMYGAYGSHLISDATTKRGLPFLI